MIIQKILKMVIFLVFLGWLMIWIMLPTKTHEDKWTPNLQMKLNSTYFEGQGTVTGFSFFSCFRLPIHPPMLIAQLVYTYITTYR